MPDIAIGIPVRFRPDWLKATLSSLAADPPGDSRVFLLPDAPDRDTLNALDDLSHLPQISSDSRHGNAACFNRLIHATQADFYVLLEAGAIPGPFWIDRLVAAFRRYPACGIAGPSTNRGSNEQCLSLIASDESGNIAASARAVARRFGSSCRSLEPRYALADFCFMVRREVVEAAGDADELYGEGPFWAMDYSVRARRAGFQILWACAAWVQRAPESSEEHDTELLDAARRRYQDKFCGLRLHGKKEDYREHCRGDACENFAPASLISIAAPLQVSPIPAKPSDPVAPPTVAEPQTPLVSCIMPTYNRRTFVPAALQRFLSQDYPALELIVVDDGSDSVQDLMPADERVRYFRLEGKLSVGAKRNFACEHARGSLIAHWDDDDWYASTRIRRQVEALAASGAEVCGTSVMYYFDESRDRAFRYSLGGAVPSWMAALVYKRSVWSQNRFEEIRLAEDVKFLGRVPAAARLDLRDHTITIGAIHKSNTSPKITSGTYWKPESPQTVRALINADRMDSPAPVARIPGPGSRALVSAASGIGDMLRVTPLIRVLARLGFAVDLLLEPDYPEAIQLLDGHSEIGEVFYSASRYSAQRQERLNNLASRNYEIATFTVLSAPWQTRVTARRKLAFDRAEWLRHGDNHCVETIARQLGWAGELPPAFALASSRRFDLAPGTVAIHPGCKPEWHWKKWHGFDELAAMYSEVALIGAESDLRNDRTYFKRDFAWPPHVRNFIGQLSLPDTAALLSQCSALVSNDSGLMHLGVALGVPTIGIFGITSPRREAMQNPSMFPITAQLSCEPACRDKPWGRSDCEHHLACLKTLTASQVFEKVTEKVNQPLPTAVQAASRVAKTNGTAKKGTPAMPTIGVTYHGHVFDASGYGSAARAYVHALHAAGIELAVADLSRHERQVRDPLIESLARRSLDSHFHIFHGIPPIWAREAFRVPNAIAITVWETDAMPAQWRNTLNHALEVWMPCDFNVNIFQPELNKPVFKLPHAFLPTPETAGAALRATAIGTDDFVFYSIFEWQDRKFPLGQLSAYFRAFPDDGPHIFVVKCNPGAVGAAAQTLEEARRVTPSHARVAIHCEAWTDAELDALHRRGDCYISLHRGEGWCYPLFDAACRGTPVIATAYSGPLEYLSDSFHQLVPYTLTNVRQRYIYYNSRMRWAEPEIGEASLRMSWVYQHREEAREKARLAVPALQTRYAPEAIGAMARERLIDLHHRGSWLQAPRRTQPEPARRAPPQPIPGDWYDADYFERGVKSNWSNGYSWAMFQGLFRDTAAFLTTMFPDVTSWLDAGCAKGFLIAALREKGREAWGFDASPWAIDHAVEAAIPHVRKADAASVDWDCRVEFTVALDLLSHLTEDQAMAFLSRARAWTSVGLLATIPTREDNVSDPDGRDPSHITRRSRIWWDERFAQAGWRRDRLHQALERACQNHALPQKMGWQIFLYAPA